MLKKLLSAWVLACVFFGAAYSTEKQPQGESNTVETSGVVDPLALITKLAVDQQYADLDAQIRANADNKNIHGLFDLIQACVDKTGDVCMLYHICRFYYISASTSGMPLPDNTITRIQKSYLTLLIRIYMDVSACKVLQLNKEVVYDLFREKVRDLWYPAVAHYDGNFGELIEAAPKIIEGVLVALPSAIWVCYCTGPCLRQVGIYPNTIYFGNIDNFHVASYSANIVSINTERSLALKRIKAKLQAIAAAQKSNQEKWAEFLSLTYKDI